MWDLRDFSRETTTFRLDGLGTQSGSRIVSGHTVLVHVVELVDWATADIQVTVCSACGTPGCRSGDWISLRAAGDYVVISPAFELMESTPLGHELYAPPAYLRERGAAYLDLDAYSQLLGLVPALADAAMLPALSSREASLLFQLDAPGGVFGHPPAGLRTDVPEVIGSSTGDGAGTLARLGRVWSQLHAAASGVRLRPIEPGEPTEDVFLDAFGFVDLPVLGGTDSSLLVIGGRFVASPTTAG